MSYGLSLSFLGPRQREREREMTAVERERGNEDRLWSSHLISKSRARARIVLHIYNTVIIIIKKECAF